MAVSLARLLIADSIAEQVNLFDGGDDLDELVDQAIGDVYDPMQEFSG